MEEFEYNGWRVVIGDNVVGVSNRPATDAAKAAGDPQPEPQSAVLPMPVFREIVDNMNRMLGYDERVHDVKVNLEELQMVSSTGTVCGVCHQPYDDSHRRELAEVRHPEGGKLGIYYCAMRKNCGRAAAMRVLNAEIAALEDATREETEEEAAQTIQMPKIETEETRWGTEDVPHDEEHPAVEQEAVDIQGLLAGRRAKIKADRLPSRPPEQDGDR